MNSVKSFCPESSRVLGRGVAYKQGGLLVHRIPLLQPTQTWSNIRDMVWYMNRSMCWLNTCEAASQAPLTKTFRTITNQLTSTPSSARPATLPYLAASDDFSSCKHCQTIASIVITGFISCKRFAIHSATPLFEVVHRLRQHLALSMVNYCNRRIFYISDRHARMTLSTWKQRAKGQVSSAGQSWFYLAIISIPEKQISARTPGHWQNRKVFESMPRMA